MARMLRYGVPRTRRGPPATRIMRTYGLRPCFNDETTLIEPNPLGVLLIGKKRRRPGLRAPPCELRPTDLAATTASDVDEARNTQARDSRGSTRPRSRRDQSRRTALGQRLRRLEARQPPHSLPLRRRWTRATSPTNRTGVSWVILPSLPHEFAPQVPRHSDCLVFPGTSELRSFLSVKSLPGISDMDRLPPRTRCLEPADAGRDALGQFLLADSRPTGTRPGRADRVR